jgi:uncharacterized membrane protein
MSTIPVVYMSIIGTIISMIIAIIIFAIIVPVICVFIWTAYKRNTKHPKKINNSVAEPTTKEETDS